MKKESNARRGGERRLENSVNSEEVDLLVVHAAELITCKTPGHVARGDGLTQLDCMSDAAIAIRGGQIIAVGRTNDISERYESQRVIDARGQLVSPGLVDSHTHLVHAGSRHRDWEAAVTGVHQNAIDSGIRTTLDATRSATTRELRIKALSDLDVMLINGTTTVEAKSGYGLDRQTELRLLQTSAELEHPITLVTTYLGAHVLPPEFISNRSGYLDLVLDLLPTARQYATYCDVACDPISFTAAECERIAQVAISLGYGLRVHADQTGDAQGTELAVRHHASSADHLDHVSEHGLSLLAQSETVGTIFPSVTHHLLETVPKGGEPALLTDRPCWARRLIDSGAALALSTDYNPGTSPCRSMQTVMQLAARLYRLSYSEIWYMSTINPARALDRAGQIGSLEPGKRADIIIWRVPEHGMVINQFGTNHVHTVIAGGEVVVSDGTIDSRLRATRPTS